MELIQKWLSQGIVMLKNSLVHFKNFFNSKLGLVVKLLLSVIILVFFFTRIDTAKLGVVLHSIQPKYVFYVLLLIIFRTIVLGFRFQFLSSIQKHVSLFVLTKQYFISYMFNIILPSVIGGDAARVFLLAQEGIDKRSGFLFIFIERIVGLFTLLFIAAISILFFPIHTQWTLILVGGVVVGLIGFYFLFFSSYIQFSTLQNSLFSQDIATFQLIKANKKKLCLFFLISIFVQFLFIYTSYIIALAFNIEVGLLPFLVFIPLIWLIVMLPITIGGIGLREAAFVYFFTQIGVSEESALILSLSTYLTFVISGLIGAILFLYDRVFANLKYDI